MIDNDEIKKIVKQNEKSRQIILNRNCVINGMIFRNESEQTLSTEGNK